MPEEARQHRLCAIMFSDIVGYSKMMGEDESGTMTFLKEHNEIVRKEVAAHQGQVVKTGGDSFLVRFDSAVNATRCAVGIQMGMDKYNHGHHKKRYLRIGIHIGEVILEDNDIFGDGVNVAARLEPIADPGGICISQDVYNFVKNKVELRVLPLGPHELKNIVQKVEIYRIVMDALTENNFTGSKKNWKTLSAPKLAGVAAITAALALFLWLHHPAVQRSLSEKTAALPLSTPPVTPAPPKTASNTKTKAGPQNTNLRRYFDPKNAKFIKLGNFGIPEQKKPFLTAEGEIVFVFDSGTEWGCGFSVFPNALPLLPQGEIDLTGCQFVEFELLTPAELKYEIHLTESGIGPMDQTSFDGANGADGEQYIRNQLVGEASWTKIKMTLSDFYASTHYGNQKGNKKLDLQGLKNFEVLILPNQSWGEIRLRNLVFLKS